MLDGVQAATQPPGERLAADLVDGLGGQAAARSLGLDLERHQHLLDEGAGAHLELFLLWGRR